MDAVEITRRINGAATERSPWKSALRDAILPVSSIPVLNRKMIYRLSRLVDR